jgi:hypothetical protein
MITDYPQPPADRAVPTAVTNDRAIAGPDQPTDRATTPRYTPFDSNPEPLNRRGRRHMEREIRRISRSIFRTACRHRSAELVAR